MSETLETLHDCLSKAETVYADLTDIGITSGAVGVSRKLVQKIESAIQFYEKNGESWDQNERLACNAWRMWRRCETGVFPDGTDWTKLPDDTKAQWRVAAAEFRSGTTD